MSRASATLAVSVFDSNSFFSQTTEHKSLCPKMVILNHIELSQSFYIEVAQVGVSSSAAFFEPKKIIEEILCNFLVRTLQY